MFRIYEIKVDPLVIRSSLNLVIGNGLVSVQGVSTVEWYLKLAHYILLTELVRYINSHVPVYISMHVPCLGEETILLSSDFSKGIKLCKNSFLGSPCKVVFVLVNSVLQLQLFKAVTVATKWVLKCQYYFLKSGVVIFYKLLN